MFCRGRVAARWHVTVGPRIYRGVDETMHSFERYVDVGISGRSKDGRSE
jgi:hypothetical protein